MTATVKFRPIQLGGPRNAELRKVAKVFSG